MLTITIRVEADKASESELPGVAALKDKWRAEAEDIDPPSRRFRETGLAPFTVLAGGRGESR